MMPNKDGGTALRQQPGPASGSLKNNGKSPALI
jgi:hypothetical protein